MELQKPRKILIFSLVYYPRFVGGAEIAIKEITDRISSREIEFHMITLRLDSTLPRYEKMGNIHIHRVGWSSCKVQSPRTLPWYIHFNKYALLATGYFKAMSLHAKHHYDALWSMMATYNSFAALFFKLRNPKVPFILTLQEGDPIPFIKRRALPLYPLFKMIFKKADHIQTLSEYLAEFARSMKATCPITVVPNAVDFELFSKRITDEKAQELKNKLGKKPEDTFLISTSRLVKKNALGDVIYALTYLPKEVKFLILGEGYEEKMLKEKVEKLHLTDRVQFLGYIPHKEMPPYLQISDIFIRPSLSEGFGSSFIEAMAAQIPVIATPVGGILDFLKDGETGLLCEVSNPRSIAQKIEKLLKDLESRDYIVRTAYDMVKETYDWGIISDDMKKLLLMTHI